MTENITETLQELTLTIMKTVQEGVSKGEFPPENELAFRWKIENFQYTDTGIRTSQARGDYLTKQSWIRASLRVLERTKQTNSYSNCYEQLCKTFGDDAKCTRDLETFAKRVIRSCFYESLTNDARIKSLMANFLRDLRGEPVKYGADVELDGIVLRPETIELDFGITLRQPKIEDLEKETPVFFPMAPDFFPPNPSAYLSIEFLGRAAREVQIKVERAITTLRLFRVGSVKYSSYRIYSDSVTDMMAGGTVTAGSRDPALDKYVVAVEDATRLRKFWQTIGEYLPPALFEFDQTKADHLTIAYTRYSDGLLQNGVIERRIANAIMGMESLYLKRSETQELAYRLGVRVGKLLRMLGFDHHEVKRNLSDAYRIRSLFAHGSQLSYKEKRKLELKYKDLKNLLVTVLDYLRISITVAIVLKRGKDELIDMLDDSLIDNQKEDQLRSLLSSTKDVIG